MEKLFLDDLPNILSIIVSAPIVYVTVILFIRIVGKRTTSEMNSFDWIVTVAMGSLVASTVVLKGVPLIAGVTAIFMLMILQYILTKIVKNSKHIRKIVQSTPQLLLYKGKFINENMYAERIARTEVYAAIRQKGLPNINEVYAVVLESNAKFSVIGMGESNTPFSLADVHGLPDGLKEDLEQIRNNEKSLDYDL